MTDSLPPDNDDDELPEEIELEITDTLDLHTFRPAEVSDVVAGYLLEARERGFRHVRIIHGKGIGSLRRTVHALLDRTSFVVSYRLADESGGSWGATLVELDV